MYVRMHVGIYVCMDVHAYVCLCARVRVGELETDSGLLATQTSSAAPEDPRATKRVNLLILE